MLHLAVIDDKHLLGETFLQVLCRLDEEVYDFVQLIGGQLVFTAEYLLVCGFVVFRL